MKADNLILWAGQLQPDIDFDLTRKVTSQTKMYVVYGVQDKFLANVNNNEYMKSFSVTAFSPQIILFEGKRKIH